MVVRVLADIVEVVVFATSADALLAVDGALHLAKVAVGVGNAQKDGLELGGARGKVGGRNGAGGGG